MPTFFIAPDTVVTDPIRVDGPLFHHLARSLRLRVGEELTLVAGGTVLTGTVAEITRDHLLVHVRTSAPAPPDAVDVTLAVGLPKGRKLDEVVRRAVELGVSRIQPLETRRTVVRTGGGGSRGNRSHAHPDDNDASWAQRLHRLQQIAVEAAQQSGRYRVPELLPPQPVIPWSTRDRDRARVLLWEDEASVRLRDWVGDRPPACLTVAVGPEGGWALEEVKALTDEGFATARLGRHILRTETACVAALAVVAAAVPMEEDT